MMFETTSSCYHSHYMVVSRRVCVNPNRYPNLDLPVLSPSLPAYPAPPAFDSSTDCQTKPRYQSWPGPVPRFSWGGRSIACVRTSSALANKFCPCCCYPPSTHHPSVPPSSNPQPTPPSSSLKNSPISHYVKSYPT